MQIPEIRLLQGFGPLPFGASKDNAVSLFGEPEEIQNLSDDILNNHSMVYHYWGLGFSLFFDLNREQAFCSVEIDNRDTVLFGARIFSLNEKQLVQLMKDHKFSLSDTEVHNWGEKRVSFDEAQLDCYFENSKMVSLNFGVTDSHNFQYFPN